MSADRGIVSVLIVLLVLSGVAAAVVWRLLEAEDAAPGPQRAPPAELPSTEGVEVASTELFGEFRPVEAATVVRDTLWIQVVGTGMAVASKRSRVATRTAGIVQGVHALEGDLVRQGDLLVQLDTAQALLNLIRAQEGLTRAQAQFDQRMLQIGAPGELLSAEDRARREQVVRAEVGLVEAELTVAERQMELEFTRVRAPFTGRVADLGVVEGSYVQSGTEVLTLVSVDPIHVEVDVLESELGLISVGRRASVRFSALGGEPLPATVESINPRVEPGTRTGRVTLSLPNPDGRVLPGSYASAHLETEPFPDRVLVPRQAITSRGEPHRDVVFLLREADGEGRGVAEWNYVAVGRRNDTWVEIVPGDDSSVPRPGELVLVAGHHYLAHNTAVQVVDNVYLAGGTPGR